jgi:nucleotide-binding universal stress UspA family protein
MSGPTAQSRNGASAGAPAVSAQGAVLPGSPAETLVQESRRTDLMVLGTRGRGDFSAAWLGSVSTAVAPHAYCPIVIIGGDRPRIPGPGFPVVGLDGSQSSARALEVAADLAAQAHAQQRVVSVWAGLAEDNRMAAYASGMSPSADSFARWRVAPPSRSPSRPLTPPGRPTRSWKSPSSSWRGTPPTGWVRQPTGRVCWWLAAAVVVPSPAWCWARSVTQSCRPPAAR